MNRVRIHVAPPGSELLKRLRGMQGRSGNFTTLVLISVSVLPLGNANEEFWSDFDRVLWELRERFNAQLYELAEPDRALLLMMTEYNQVGMMSDMKVAILRLIQSYFPEQFGLIDQSRLIRGIDLRLKLANAIKYLERIEEQPGKSGDKKPEKLRPLIEDDIDNVKKVSSELGAKQFSRVFIRHQRIAVINPGEEPSDVMHEYFVAMNELQDHVFKKVELRGSGNLFNQLTLTLDQALLKAFGEVNPMRVKCSININVESVFTDAFKAIMQGDDDQAFSNIAFEFRQANMLQQYDEYMVASKLILNRNGTICVDAIFPESVGIVSLKRLNASMGKIFWRQGAESVLPIYEDDIKYLLDSGIQLCLARLDDEQGLELGQKMGITMFQGFLIDKMLEGGDSG